MGCDVSHKNSAKTFWRRVNISGPNDCWLWKNPKSRSYPVIRWGDGKQYPVHRVAYYLTFGSIELAIGDVNRATYDRFVLHTCDVTTCCNPRHLFLGTQAENNKDCKNKGRMRRAKGEAHRSAKLTALCAAQIRARYKVENISYAKLAYIYGVTPCTIGKIIRRQSWV